MHEQLCEHFSLAMPERQFVQIFRRTANQQAMVSCSRSYPISAISRAPCTRFQRRCEASSWSGWVMRRTRASCTACSRNSFGYGCRVMYSISPLPTLSVPQAGMVPLHSTPCSSISPWTLPFRWAQGAPNACPGKSWGGRTTTSILETSLLASHSTLHLTINRL